MGDRGGGEEEGRVRNRRRRRERGGEVVNTESGLDPHHQTHRAEGGQKSKDET